MNNITYQTKKVRIEKILREEKDPVTGNITFVTYYQGYSRISIPCTFGLLKKWVRAAGLQTTETAATSTAASTLFKSKYNIPVVEKANVPQHLLMAAAKSVREGREIPVTR